MFKSIITSIAILSGLTTFSQVSENRSVADFSKLKAATSVHVFYTVSKTKSVKVETDDNEKLKLVKTEVENGTLSIFVDNGKGHKGNRRFKTLNVYVSGPSLSSIKASSSADVKIENTNDANSVSIAVSSSASVTGKFDCTEISIDASSSGDLKAQIVARSVAVETSSSADVDLIGKTGKLKVEASSSSSCDANNLKADDVTVTASSSADVDVFASKSLNAKASSSGSIDYYGNPAQVVADKNSSGSVNKK